MLEWHDFLTNIKAYKKGYKAGQLRMDYGTLSTLLYAGAFDSMFGRDLQLKDIEEAALNLKLALGSEAEPKEAKKNEMFGIADIDSQIRLLLWRNQNLPTTRFELARHFKNALTQLGLRENIGNLNSPFKNDTQDLWLSWNQVATDQRIHRVYMQKEAPKKPSFVGMIEEVNPFTYGQEKEAIRFKLFTGIDYVPTVIWPKGKNTKIESYLKKDIIKKQYGLAVVRLASYHNEITASLYSWNTIRV